MSCETEAQLAERFNNFCAPHNYGGRWESAVCVRLCQNEADPRINFGLPHYITCIKDYGNEDCNVNGSRNPIALSAGDDTADRNGQIVARIEKYRSWSFPSALTCTVKIKKIEEYNGVELANENPLLPEFTVTKPQDLCIKIPKEEGNYIGRYLLTITLKATATHIVVKHLNKGTKASDNTFTSIDFTDELTEPKNTKIIIRRTYIYQRIRPTVSDIALRTTAIRAFNYPDDANELSRKRAYGNEDAIRGTALILDPPAENSIRFNRRFLMDLARQTVEEKRKEREAIEAEYVEAAKYGGPNTAGAKALERKLATKTAEVVTACRAADVAQGIVTATATNIPAESLLAQADLVHAMRLSACPEGIGPYSSRPLKNSKSKDARDSEKKLRNAETNLGTLRQELANKVEGLTNARVNVQEADKYKKAADNRVRIAQEARPRVSEAIIEEAKKVAELERINLEIARKFEADAEDAVEEAKTSINKASDTAAKERRLANNAAMDLRIVNIFQAIYTGEYCLPFRGGDKYADGNGEMIGRTFNQGFWGLNSHRGSVSSLRNGVNGYGAIDIGAGIGGGTDHGIVIFSPLGGVVHYRNGDKLAQGYTQDEYNKNFTKFNRIIIRSDERDGLNGTYDVEYLHIRANTSDHLKQGQRIEKGTPIGIVGDYGSPGSKHLDIRVKPVIFGENGTPDQLDCIDPLRLFDFDNNDRTRPPFLRFVFNIYN